MHIHVEMGAKGFQASFISCWTYRTEAAMRRHLPPRRLSSEPSYEHRRPARLIQSIHAVPLASPPRLHEPFTLLLSREEGLHEVADRPLFARASAAPSCPYQQQEASPA